jgi:protein-L-isoaspartate(D-aspartate) O-methyltransferase
MMVANLWRNIVNEDVLRAMEKVQRHLFVPEDMRKHAYEDRPLPIGDGQTISAPHMVAVMCDLLCLRDGLRVLEIGAGSGYHAAVIAELIGEGGYVYTIERIPALARFARDNLSKVRYSNVKVIVGDGTLGFPDSAPYDRICVTCAAPDVPPPLVEQLKIGGRMVIPMGKVFQDLYVIVRENGIIKERKMSVVFVPLIGEQGFHD